MERSENTETPINMAMLFYQGLHDIDMNMLDKTFLGDVDGYFNSLHQKFIYCSWRFNNQEQNNIQIKLDNVAKKIMQINLVKDNIIRRNKTIEINKMLGDIDKEIWKYRSKYHMTFPEIKGNKGIGGLEKRYKLGVKNE